MAQDDEVPIMAWIVFLVSLVLFVLLIPAEIWKMLLWLGAVVVTGYVAWLSLILLLTSNSQSL